MSYSIAKATQQTLEDEYYAACKLLGSIPGIGSGPMGLTPESIQKTDEYRIAKRACADAFAAL